MVAWTMLRTMRARMSVWRVEASTISAPLRSSASSTLETTCEVPSKKASMMVV